VSAEPTVLHPRTWGLLECEGACEWCSVARADLATHDYCSATSAVPAPCACFDAAPERHPLRGFARDEMVDAS